MLKTGRPQGLSKPEYKARMWVKPPAATNPAGIDDVDWGAYMPPGENHAGNCWPSRTRKFPALQELLEAHLGKVSICAVWAAG